MSEAVPPILWQPPADIREQDTTFGRFLDFLRDSKGHDFAGYDDLQEWSIADQEGFWGALAEFFEVKWRRPYERVLAAAEMPGAKWFAGSELNYIEHMIGSDEILDETVIVSRSQTREPIDLTWRELREQVARCRAGLVRLGVGRGDRVVGFLPNTHETVVAFMATASLGAIWSTVAAEFGPRSTIDRFGQLEPKVLLAVAGYGFRDREIDRRETVAEIRAHLPSLEHVVGIPYGRFVLEDADLQWDELLAEEAPLEFDPVPFDHPIYVLFSSGTTGLPKAIIHGHGGVLLEHFKACALQWGLEPGGRLLQFTTTAWMMWNGLVSALLVPASIVLIDGDPTWPDLGYQWRLAAETGATMMSTSSAFAMACRKADVPISTEADLSRLEGLVTAGSPLPAEGYEYLYRHLRPEVLLINGSGGTDVCTGIVSGCHWKTVYEGEISGCCLGFDVAAFDPEGNPVVGELGELVIRKPVPSMPVGFWGDDESMTRYREAYFDVYPGVWRHGDWIRFTERGTCVITGRSDATLNRGGVRLGTSELYAVIEELPEIADSVVVHLEDPEGGVGELILFAALAPGVEMGDELRAKVAAALRSQLSPRHVPDTMVAVPEIPRTLTGKKLEAPVKRIMQGTPAEKVAAKDALANPDSIDAFVAYATQRGALGKAQA
jgi:acetoacetyl-CoA synthetase